SRTTFFMIPLLLSISLNVNAGLANGASYQLSGVEDQADASVGEDRRRGDAGEFSEDFSEGLDDGLHLSDEVIDHECDFFGLRPDHDQLFDRRCVRMVDGEEPAKADVGQHALLDLDEPVREVARLAR